MALGMIIAGGQTGVDRGALDAALVRAFLCGGWCPPGRLADDSPISTDYPLSELTHGGYRQWTMRNVVESDGAAILYFAYLEGRTEQTTSFCIKHREP